MVYTYLNLIHVIQYQQYKLDSLVNYNFLIL